MARAASFPAKWTRRSYNNWRMQDDASVPENQDATSGTLEHALGEAALAAAFDFVEERVCQKIERYGIKLGRRSRKKVSYPARENASRRNTQFH